ncbi:MAG TPA: hypothetical protein VFB13_05050 [Reyranella sp.]|jgi:hypothetical protein|nr:hypothetical protein [Reyranella sp.]
MSASLEDVLKRLHRSGINCGVLTFPPTHIAAYLAVGRRIESKRFGGDEPEGAIANWLNEAAERFYGKQVAGGSGGGEEPED